MPGYLLDTMVLEAFHRSRVPEKWRRPWNDIRGGSKSVVLVEELLAELHHRIARREGEDGARHWILWLKRLPRALVRAADDSAAFDVGHLYLQLHGSCDVSLADCFALSFARREHAELVTTDIGLRKAARMLGSRVSWLPATSLA